MRANPHLLRGHNRFWVKFFTLAAFATMYVRDHARPEFHKALGLDLTEYDYQVFRITSEISKQVFPVTLDIDDPRFRAGLERLRKLSVGIERAKKRGGVLGRLKMLGLIGAAGLTMARVYLLPAKKNALPDAARLQPVW